MQRLLIYPREKTPVCKPGEIVREPNCGGTFYRVEHIWPGQRASAKGTDPVWYVTVTPLLGLTLVEELSAMYRAVLSATGMEPVEIALHVGEFARRAMQRVKELRNGSLLNTVQAAN